MKHGKRNAKQAKQCQLIYQPVPSVADDTCISYANDHGVERLFMFAWRVGFWRST
jgi:hypothetical protein